MKVMKKLLAMLLAACLLIGLTGVGAKEVRADDPTELVTIHVGIISYVQDAFGSDGWKVHSWTDGSGDNEKALLRKTQTVVYKSLGGDYWEDNVQTFTMYTADIPASSSGYCILFDGENDTWFNQIGNGDLSKTTAYVFQYGETNTNKAVYEVTGSGYYLTGSFCSWALNSKYMLTQNPGNSSEYMIQNVLLTEGAEIKIAQSLNGVNFEGGQWFPNNNYAIPVTDYYDIYFNPKKEASGGEWVDKCVLVKKVYDINQTRVLAAKSLSIENDDISAKFYLRVPDSAVNTEVSFTWGDGKSDNDKISAEKTKIDDMGNTLYEVTCHVPAAEIVDDIQIKFTLTNGNSYDFSVGSIMETAFIYLRGDYKQDAKAVAKAILSYGAACQTQFGYKTEKLATDNEDGIQFEVGNYRKDEIKNFTGAAPALPKKLTIDNNLSGYGLEYVGYTLLLQSKTTLRVYFKTTESFNADPRFFCGDEPLDLCKYDESGVYRYVDIRNIKVSDLDVNYELKIAKDANGEKSAVGSFSGLSYMALALKDADDTLKNTVCALYDYYKAAETWLETRWS